MSIVRGFDPESWWDYIPAGGKQNKNGMERFKRRTEKKTRKSAHREHQTLDGVSKANLNSRGEGTKVLKSC